MQVSRKRVRGLCGIQTPTSGKRIWKRAATLRNLAPPGRVPSSVREPSRHLRPSAASMLMRTSRVWRRAPVLAAGFHTRAFGPAWQQLEIDFERASRQLRSSDHPDQNDASHQMLKQCKALNAGVVRRLQVCAASDVAELRAQAERAVNSALRLQAHIERERPAAAPSTHLIIAQHHLGVMMAEHSGPAAALPWARLAQSNSRHVFGDMHPKTIRLVKALGDLEAANGNLSSAEILLREATESYTAVYGEQHEEWLSASFAFGDVLARRGKLVQAEPVLRRTHRVALAMHGRSAPQAIAAAANLASLLLEVGEAPGSDGDALVEAKELFATLVRSCTSVHGPPHRSETTRHMCVLQEHCKALLLR